MGNYVDPIKRKGIPENDILEAQCPSLEDIKNQIERCVEVGKTGDDLAVHLATLFRPSPSWFKIFIELLFPDCSARRSDIPYILDPFRLSLGHYYESAGDQFNLVNFLNVNFVRSEAGSEYLFPTAIQTVSCCECHEKVLSRKFSSHVQKEHGDKSEIKCPYCGEAVHSKDWNNHFGLHLSHRENALREIHNVQFDFNLIETDLIANCQNVTKELDLDLRVRVWIQFYKIRNGYSMNSEVGVRRIDSLIQRAKEKFARDLSFYQKKYKRYEYVLEGSSPPRAFE